MSFTEFIDTVIDDKIKDIQLGIVGKIVVFNPALMRADVDPLMKIKNDLDEEIDLPILPDLPVGFHYGGGFLIKPTYIKDDLVWISFSTHDFAEALQGYKRVASEKKFEIHNASVTHGIAPDAFVFPPFQLAALNKEGLVMVNQTGQGLRIDNIGVFALNGLVEFNILTHTHPYVDTPVGASVTSPPLPGS